MVNEYHKIIGKERGFEKRSGTMTRNIMELDYQLFRPEAEVI